MLKYLRNSFQMSSATSSSSSHGLFQSVYSNLDFSQLKNILPSSLKSISINPSSDLIREDERDDSEFYVTPRFVHHIDDRARYVLSQFYTYAIKPTSETMTLDLCSSWTSHLSEHFIGKFVKMKSVRIYLFYYI
jgi:hypothetical protein